MRELRNAGMESAAPQRLTRTFIMKTLTKLLMLVIGCCSIVASQSLKLSVSAISGGGGKSSGATLGMYASSGVPGTSINSGGGGNYFGHVSGIIPVLESATGIHTGITNIVEEGWNMISVPLRVTNYAKSVLFPSVSSSAFSYSGSYVPNTVLANGIGYWMNFDSSGSNSIVGSWTTWDTIPVSNHWNMIGGTSFPLPVANITALPPSTIVLPFYGFSNGLGYVPVDILIPGRAYWVNVAGAGQLILGTNFSIVESNSRMGPLEQGEKQAMEKRFSTLTLTDSKGQRRTLYFSSVVQDIDAVKYELPPTAPDAIMDVRYQSNRNLVVAERGKPREMKVRISSAEYPVTIRWDIATGDGRACLIVDGKEVVMAGISEVKVQRAESQIRLKLTALNTPELPGKFLLEQNYPNPFNPSTVIRYQLPMNGHVLLKVYDMLGREVATLINERQDAGYKSVTFDAVNLPSGVYLYKLQAGTFSSVKKTILLR